MNSLKTGGSSSKAVALATLILFCGVAHSDCGQIPIVPNNPGLLGSLGIIPGNVIPGSGPLGSNNPGNPGPIVVGGGGPTNPIGGPVPGTGTNPSDPDPILIDPSDLGLGAVGGAGSPNIADPTDIPDPISIDGWTPVQARAFAEGSYFQEPSQRAVLAWNGTEEILVLMTEQQSMVGSGATLSIMPLPGRPISVTRASNELFNEFKTLLESKAPAPEGVPKGVPYVEAAELVLQEKIGAHHIFVFRANRVEGFVNAVGREVGKIYGNKAVPAVQPITQKVIAKYMQAGFQYFAFDLVQTKDELAEKEAIRYHFESPSVFYPMIISRSGGTGHSEVDLIVITPGQVTQKMGNLQDPTITLKTNLEDQEIRNLDEKMADLFGGRGAFARHWNFSGDINKFGGDVLYR